MKWISTLLLRMWHHPSPIHQTCAIHVHVYRIGTHVWYISMYNIVTYPYCWMWPWNAVVTWYQQCINASTWSQVNPREAKPRGASIYLWSTQMIKSSKSMVVQFGISSSSRNALLGVHSERQSWPLPKHKPNVDHSLVCLVNHNLHNLSGLSLLSWSEPPLTGWFENIYLHLQLL